MSFSIVVTGFGVFAGVSDNPSRQLVESYAENPQVTTQGTMCSVMEVSVNACSQFHDTFFNRSEIEQNDFEAVNIPCKMEGRNEGSSIFVHIGVDSKARQMKLEQSAYNNMSFRVADEAGFQPQNCVISSDHPLDEPLSTDFPLELFCNTLNETFGSEFCYRAETATTTDSSVSRGCVTNTVQEQDATVELVGTATAVTPGVAGDNTASTDESLVRVSQDPGRFLCIYTTKPFYTSRRRNCLCNLCLCMYHPSMWCPRNCSCVLLHTLFHSYGNTLVSL
jgi:pyrrolidone-carboxylate peptidase